MAIRVHVGDSPPNNVRLVGYVNSPLTRGPPGKPLTVTSGYNIQGLGRRERNPKKKHSYVPKNTRGRSEQSRCNDRSFHFQKPKRVRMAINLKEMNKILNRNGVFKIPRPP